MSHLSLPYDNYSQCLGKKWIDITMVKKWYIYNLHMPILNLHLWYILKSNNYLQMKISIKCLLTIRTTFNILTRLTKAST